MLRNRVASQYIPTKLLLTTGFFGGSAVKNTPVNEGGTGLDPWAREISWRRKWQPTLVFLLGKSHAQSNLVGYIPQGCKRVRQDLATEH